MEARLPHEPPHPINAKPHHPEPHLPGTVEHALGTGLHADPTERARHPGVPCDALPSHAHPLPECGALRKEKDALAKKEPTTPPVTPVEDVTAEQMAV
jgi:hypothetical protein